MNTDISLVVSKSVSVASESKSDHKVENISHSGVSEQVEASESAISQAGAPSETKSDLDETVKSMNDLAQNLHRQLLFSIDDRTGDYFVKVVDKETDEVIREIPSEEMRELKARLEETTGVIFNDIV